MAWRKPTEADIVATLSRDEVEAYRASSDFEDDPIARLLDRTAAFVRGYLATNGNIRMSPDDHEIPEATISPAMNYLAVDILKRIDINPSDARRDARREAVSYFDKIATGKITVESYGGSADDKTGGACAVVINNARPHVTSHKLEGL